MKLSEEHLKQNAANANMSIEEYKAAYPSLFIEPKVGDFLKGDEVKKLIQDNKSGFYSEEKIVKGLTEILEGTNWGIEEYGVEAELIPGVKTQFSALGNAIKLRSEGGVEKVFDMSGNVEEEVVKFLQENPSRGKEYEAKKEDFKVFLNEYYTEEEYISPKGVKYKNKLEYITGKEFLANVKDEKELKKKIKEDLGYGGFFSADNRTKFPELTDGDIDHIIGEHFNEKVAASKKQKLNELSADFLVRLKAGGFKDELGNDLKTQENFFENYRNKLIETFDNKDEANLATINMKILHGNLEGDDLEKALEARKSAVEKINASGEYVSLFDYKTGELVRTPKQRSEVYKEEEKENVESDIEQQTNKIKLNYKAAGAQNGNTTLLSFVQDGFRKNAKQISELEAQLQNTTKLNYERTTYDDLSGWTTRNETSVFSTKFMLSSGKTPIGTFNIYENARPADGSMTAEEYADFLNRTREQLKGLKIQQEAYKRMYLLNEDATSIEKKTPTIGGRKIGLFGQQSGNMIVNSVFGEGTWENVSGKTATETAVVDEYVSTLNEIGVPVSPDQENYARRSFGEQVTEGVAGSAGILLQFAVANKATAALRAAKFVKDGRSLNQVLGAAKANRYTNGSVVMTEAQIAKLIKQPQIPFLQGQGYNSVRSWVSANVGKNKVWTSLGPNRIKQFGANIVEGVIEGLKFAVLPASSEDRMGSFATGFGFGLAGQILSPMLGTIRAHNTSAVMGGVKGELNSFGRFVVDQAPRLEKAYNLGFKAPLSFAVGSEIGEISLAMANDAMGMDEVSTFMKEHYSDFSETTQRFAVNFMVGSAFGLTHKATYTNQAGKVGFPMTLSKMKASSQEAYNKNVTKSKKYWTQNPITGKRKSYSKKQWEELSNERKRLMKEKPKGYKKQVTEIDAIKQSVTSEPNVFKPREKFMGGKNPQEFQRNMDLHLRLEDAVRKSETAADLLDPVLAPFAIKKMYQNQNKYYQQYGIKNIDVRTGDNKSKYFVENPTAEARVEYVSPDGKVFADAPKSMVSNPKGWTVRQTINVDKVEAGVAPHELGHSGMSILFGSDARFKAGFMQKMFNIAGKIRLEGDRTLRDAFKEINGNWGREKAWENARINEWELFSYLATELAKPENLRQLQESKAWEKFDKFIEKEVGGNLGQKYNLKTYKDVVRFFNDYITTINKGNNSLEALSHLDVVIDKSKPGEKEALGEAFKKSGVNYDGQGLQQRDLKLEIRQLVETKPEGYKKKITNLENLIKKSELNQQLTNKYKELVTLENQRGVTQQSSLLKGRQLAKLRENNKGILVDYIGTKENPGAYKDVPGSTLTRKEFQNYVENVEFLKILNSYTNRAEKFKDVPFNFYLESTLKGGSGFGGGRLGNILKALGVDMAKSLVTKSRDSKDFNEIEFAGESGGSKEMPGEAKGLELIYELPVKQETIDAITKKVKNLDLKTIDYQTLVDQAPQSTKEMFGKKTKDKAAFIAENWKTIYDLLPKNLTETTGTATGIENSLMTRKMPNGKMKNVFYKGEGETVKMADTGAKTGSELQPKIKMGKKEFLAELGIKQKPDGSVDISGMNVKVDRGITTAVLPALINQTGKAITNQIVRAEITRAGKEGWENLVNQIGSGKSEALQSRNLEMASMRDQMIFYKQVQTAKFAALLKQNLNDFEKQETAVVKTLQQYFGEYVKQNTSAKNTNPFGISNANLKLIGKQINKSFQFEKVTPNQIASKAKKAIDLPNTLEGINAKAGIKNDFRLSTEADITSALDITGFVAKKLTEIHGTGVYKNYLARGESGGSGVGKAESYADMLTGMLKDGHRFSLHEGFNQAVEFNNYTNSTGKVFKPPFTLLGDGKKVAIGAPKTYIEGQGGRDFQFQKLRNKKTGEWDVAKLNEAFGVGESAKTVLKDAVNILREGYKNKELSHTQVRQWLEIHAGSMTGLIKLSGSFAVVPNMSAKEMFKQFGKEASNYVLEHTTPAQTVKARIYDYIINGTQAKKSAMELTLRDYHTTLIPKKFDTMINKTLQTDLPSWHLPGMDPIKSRYYEANHPSDFGIGLKAFAGHNKSVVYDYHKNLTMSQKQKRGRELANINNQLFNSSLKKGADKALNSKNLKNLENIEKAAMQGRLKKKIKRGMSTFDFDETVGVSENFVFATKGNKKKKIASNEWPLVGDKLLKEGWKMDFTDFNRVTNGKPGPLMQKMKNQIKKFGSENVFILTARAPESQRAIHEYLKSEGINIPYKNITGLGNSTGEAKALWMLEKFAEGYNDMYFVDDAMPNVKAVKEVLSQLDIKSKVQQALQQRNLSKDFNKIIEESMGVEAFKEFSIAKAKMLGAKKRYNFFGSPGSEDFSGLVTYAFAGKGKKGEAHKKFFEDVLHNPYNRAWMNIHTRKQVLSEDYKALRKNNKETLQFLKSKVDDVYTVEQAIRTHLFDKAGYDVPGLSKRDFKMLTDFVRKDADLLSYAENLSKISKLKEGWLKPKDYWLAESITSDLNNVIDRVYRKEAMAEFIQNREAIFGTWKNGRLESANMNKIEATKGTSHREALENMLWRMENFTNRAHGTDATTAKWMNWVNNASSTIMFFNQKSAMLQTISNINYVNGAENNPFAAAKAFANQPQYWKDFMTIMNSDMLVQRRAGLKINVEAAEIVERVSGGKNTAGRAISVLLEKGFIPTKYADSFAISLGGATYYRNKIKMYEKQGLSTKEAEAKAWEDFSMLTEKTQQSSRPDLVSAQQASALGRPLLSFANTPMQMFRRHKRRIQDIANNRGNKAKNILSAVYYGFAQTAIFAYLSNAMFAVDDEDTSKEEFNAKTRLRYTQTIADSYLRGMGTPGAGISAIKNSLITTYLETQKPNPKYVKGVIDLLNVSPPIGSKVRKLYSAGNTFAYNRKAIKNAPTFSLANPAVHASAQIISSLTNVPTDRLVEKATNIKDASNSDFENWQRISMFLGVNKWALGLEDLERDFLNEKFKRKGPKQPKSPKSPKGPKSK